MSKRTPPPVDPGVAEIEAWRAWFLAAHTARLAELHLPPDQHDREWTAVTAAAEAVTSRRTSDYLARSGAS